MNNPSASGRGSETRNLILQAATHQFARRTYHEVGLDDILAEAGLTKGAMYFHFHSKYALAMAIIDEQIALLSAAFRERLARKLSGLETLVDFCFYIAAQDIGNDATRAALHLVITVGRVEGVRVELLGGWIRAFADVVRDAIADGDIVEECDAEDLGRLIASAYVGLRQTSDLDDPQRFLHYLERSWGLMLAGVLRPDRADYFEQFISRRAALALGAASVTRAEPATPDRGASDQSVD